MFVNGKPLTLEKGDASTVRFVAPEPYYGFPNVLAGVLGVGHHARFGRLGTGGFAPAHYLKQFLPKYTPQAQLDAKVAEAGVDNWVSLFKLKNDSARNPDLPVVTAWKTVTPITTPNWTFERNPYSIWVDAEGNQLPYIDKVQMTLAENLEVLNLRAISGEYDEQARHLDIGKLPVFIENQQKGGYTVRLDPSSQGSDMGLYLNQSYEGDPEIAKWLTNREFRIALSHGIDRAQINETFALGLAQVGSAAPDENTPYSPGPEFRTLHATYDVAKANEMLDKLGLTQKDAEGYRLRTDRPERIRLEITTYLGFLQFTQIAEMIREHWRRIGIRAEVQELERNLSIRRKDANELQIYVDTQWAGDDMFSHFPQFFPFGADNPLGPLYGAWYSSAGARGKEPPPRMKELMEKYRKAFSVPDTERVALAKDVWKIALDEVWTINVIANSPANQGLRVVKNNVGNAPERMWNSAASDNPAPAHPETYFFKS
jgi:peptide/nickel transport system substrate-binding protein